MYNVNERKITQNIRNIRINQKLSLTQLAERTGLTRGYLSKIENSHKAPPFSTLLKVAKGLNVDIGELILENQNAESLGNVDLVLVRADEIVGTKGRNNKRDFQYEALAYGKSGKNMEPFIVMPSFDEKTVFSHDGEEFMYVLTGTFEFIYGDRRYTLLQGDSIYFNPSVPHYGKSVGEQRARVLAVIYTPPRP